MSMTSDKSQLRQAVLARRKALSDMQRTNDSLQICAHIANYIEQYLMQMGRSSLHILSYMPLGDEVDVSSLHERFLESGHTLLMPRVVQADIGLMEICQYNAGTMMARSRWGIREPGADALIWPATQYEQVDIVIVPGVAYDARGARLGFGGGFYDRICPQLVNAIRIAPLFALQLVAEIPVEPHDARMDLLVQPTRVVDCQRNRYDER
jgi:5-formyltetrahydrofolate cyclo-ligase